MTDDVAKLKLIEELIAAPPQFHRRETELDRHFLPEDSWLPREQAEHLASQGLAAYGIDRELARYLLTTVKVGDRTLETGAGSSTLLIALCGAHHTAVTPSQAEVTLIQNFAASKNVNMAQVSFEVGPSERHLPAAKATHLDLVLIDGKHAFPWPVIDWFYTADRLRKGGLMILDDCNIRAVDVMVEFMKTDSRWELDAKIGEKAVAFRKLADVVHDVAWHLQPFNKPQSNLKRKRTWMFRKPS